MDIDKLSTEQEIQLMRIAVHAIVDAVFDQASDYAQAMDAITARLIKMSKGEDYEDGDPPC